MTTSPIPDPKARAAILALLKAAEGFVSAGMVYTSVKPPAHPGLDGLIAAGNELSSAASGARQFLMCKARHTFGEDLGSWSDSTCSLEADGHRRHITAEGRWWEVWSDADQPEREKILKPERERILSFIERWADKHGDVRVSQAAESIYRLAEAIRVGDHAL